MSPIVKMKYAPQIPGTTPEVISTPQKHLSSMSENPWKNQSYASCAVDHISRVDAQNKNQFYSNGKS